MSDQLLKPQQLYDYQRECVMHQLQNPDSMLWLQMGLGKTPITLTTIIELMRAGSVKKTLIFGPLRVIQAVWAREARKWEHTRHLRFSVVHGTREKRERALFADADVYLINYEAMNWLAQQLNHYYISQDKSIPFEMVVYDEVSKLKRSTTLRMAGGNRDRKDKKGNQHSIKVIGWRKMINLFKHRTGLTGTPASNGYLDLFGQYLAVDGGERLGEYITHYKNNYFMSDYNGWKYSPTKLGKQWIEQKIADITKKMDSKDYLDLPECKTINMMVDLPAAARKAYNEVEKDMFTKLDSGSEIEVFSRSSVSNKCLQFANGSPYLSPESKEFVNLHDAKLDALESILEEAAGSPVFCSYSFKADAARIMKKFKKYSLVNLTAAPSKDTEKIIDQWNQGYIKLLIGHPACVHPKTKVLTERYGWVNIVDVKPDDRIHDGVEFVQHGGCSYSGFKNIIDCFGVIMTPDHKILVHGEWREGQHVKDCEESRNKALFKWENTLCCDSKMHEVWERVGNNASECNETQQEKKQILSTLYSRLFPSHDTHQDMGNLAGNEKSGKGFFRQKLWRSWNNNVQRVGRLHDFLRRHVTGLFGQFDHRKNQCKWSLLQRKLHMGDNVQTTREQTQQPTCGLSRGNNSFGRVSKTVWFQQNDVDNEIEQGDDGGSGSRRLQEITIRKEHEKNKCSTQGKAHVYDLVNCGPRHRFLMKNDNDEMFISHNSMGHGIDGLQDSGSIIVWFGVNWSLELYDQMNGRLDRQGQKNPVSIIRILCNDTVDLAVVDAIERKTDDQEGLKNALERYRNGVTTNALNVNFF